MKLHQLRALVAIAEAGSIQEASRILHSTQPALSKAIKELEGFVGASLFERSNKGIRMTPAGQRLVAHARLIGENVRRAREDMEDMKGSVFSEVSVGVTPVTSLLKPIAGCLDAFRSRHRDARVRVLEMRPNQLLEHLREGTIDFALTSQAIPADRGLEWLEICRIPSVIAARKSHPLLTARSIRELQDADWLALDPLSDESAAFSALFDLHGLDVPNHVIECTAMNLAMALCWHTDILVLLSRESFLSPTIVDSMSIIEVEEAIPDREISLVARDRNTLTAAALQLFDEIASALRGHYPIRRSS